MEFNNNDIKDDILEFPNNYEEIANLELLNMEKNIKFDLNKLLYKGIESQNNKINDNNKMEEKVPNNDNEWKDFESDEEEENNNYNKYQKFEDDNPEEEKGKENEEINNDKKDKDEDILKENNIYSNIKLEKNENDNIIFSQKTKNVKINNDKQNNVSKDNDSIKKKKLSKDQMKKMISKIEYTPPNWAKDLNDKEFINKVQLFIIILFII